MPNEINISMTTNTAKSLSSTPVPARRKAPSAASTSSLWTLSGMMLAAASEASASATPRVSHNGTRIYSDVQEGGTVGVDSTTGDSSVTPDSHGLRNIKIIGSDAQGASDVYYSVETYTTAELGSGLPSDLREPDVSITVNDGTIIMMGEFNFDMIHEVI